jgi:hypothetical protein
MRIPIVGSQCDARSHQVLTNTFRVPIDRRSAEEQDCGKITPRNIG